MKIKKVTLVVLVAILVLANTIPVNTAKAKKSNYITVGDYIQKIVETTNIAVDKTAEQPYITAALNSGLITEGEFSSYNDDITREDAALLTERADETLHGTSYNQTLYYAIINKNRISDLKRVSEDNQDEVVKVFQKGIMVGNSNGNYTQSRAFCGTDKLKNTEVNTIMKRLTNKSSRKKISSDGQVIRTTKLPKNYKSFNYILESFPNSYYEEKFTYQIMGADLKNLVDYASPKDLSKTKFITYSHEYDMKDTLDKNLDNWCEKVEKNLYYRLNFNYKTVNSEWINGLRNTYPESNGSDFTDNIKAYVKIAKSNKVSIKTSQISVEPSTIYDGNLGYMVRCHVKFKITSANTFYTYESRKQKQLIYATNSWINLKELKKNAWYETTFDVGLSGNSMDDNGANFAVTTDWMY